MPNIQGGGGAFIPRQVQNTQAQQQVGQTQQAAKAQEQAGPKDTVRMQQGPSQTSLSSQVAQRLTADGTRSQIHQLIQQQQVQVPDQKPNLQMMQRPAMSSALADMLAGHHVPDQGQNLHAQQAGGSLAAASHQKVNDHTEDSAKRTSLQSGKRVRKEEQEGEFSSLEDMMGGESSQQNEQDERSDSQKQKHILTQEQRRKKALKPTGALKQAPQKPGLKKTGGTGGLTRYAPGVKPAGQKNAPQQQRPSSIVRKAAPEKPAEDQPFSGVKAKPTIQKINRLQKPKPKTDDEWTI